ncbi:MAG TPA: gfo/Idh/MocA family oxidoreductase, partial [Planctomycetaceae bacterium]|nr:gfo/Idh/MocA family oxidoreductase [Planctomycetaceae bacterium]
CGTEGTFQIEPLDAPTARFAFATARGKYARGYQEVKFGDFHRYVADVADLARIVRGEKESDVTYTHNFEVQKTVLEASGLPIDR